MSERLVWVKFAYTATMNIDECKAGLLSITAKTNKNTLYACSLRYVRMSCALLAGFAFSNTLMMVKLSSMI